MHIMEGFLPLKHAVAWTAASAPFLAAGIWSARRSLRDHPERRMLLGVSAAFSFLLSAMKLPSVTGSCSHPTGVGLGALLFGPLAMVPVSFVVLLFQALLLAHGGLTTLGANLVSMGIAGPLMAAAVFRTGRVLRLPLSVNVFLAATLADLVTYVVTSLQLALAFPDAVSGVAGSMLKFGGIFAVTQIPLAISEGLLTVLVVQAMTRLQGEDLRGLPLYAGQEVRA